MATTTKKKKTTAKTVVTYTPKTWAEKLLSLLGDKDTTANVAGVVAWEDEEGGNWENDAAFNPLNTTQSQPGAGNTGAQGDIKVYKSWGQGLKATVTTLRNGDYSSILAALKSGKSAAAVDNAVDVSPWGTTDAIATLDSGSYKAYGNLTSSGAVGAIDLGTPLATATTGSTSSSSTPSLFSLAGFERLILEGVFVAGGVGLIGLGAYRSVTGQTPHPIKAAKNAAGDAAKAGALA